MGVGPIQVRASVGSSIWPLEPLALHCATVIYCADRFQGTSMAHLFAILLLAVASPGQEKSFGQLIAELDDFATDRAAAQALREAGPKALPALLEAFKPGESYSRDTIALLLGELAPDHPRAKQALLQAFEDKAEDSVVRATCALGLGPLARTDQVVLKALLQGLRDRNADVRVGVAESFRRMKDKPQPAIPAFLKALKDEDCRVRASAACSVAQTVEPKVAAAAILESLKGFQDAPSPDLEHVTALSQTAGALAGVGAPAVPYLVKALSDADKRVREGAVEALGSVAPITPDVLEAVPTITRLLRDKETDVRLAACGTLFLLGDEASLAVPDLVSLLGDENAQIRGEAALALSNMGAAAAPAVPSLIKATKDRNLAVRRAAILALKGTGPDAKAAVPALIEALKREDVRLHAMAALGAIGPAAKPAIPALQALQGEDEDLNSRISLTIDLILGRPIPRPPLLLVPVIRRSAR
jgi:HEAT repeat protein